MRLFAVLFVLCASLDAFAASFTVAIDPGHGGPHDGALSPDGAREKDVALAVARELRTLLESDGVRAVLTRDDDVDVPLVDRTALANAAKADLLVSIHCNSMPTKKARKRVQGIETYFLSANASDADAHALAARENADGAQEETPSALDPIGLILQDLSRSQAHADASLLARHVHRALVGGLEARDRGVKQAPFVVLLGAEMPAILVEVGFISHPEEGRLLTSVDYQKRIAAALLAGIHEFRNRVHVRRVAPVSAEAHDPASP